MGTDTLEEVAFALDVLTFGAAPVVVTGAMRAPSAAGADGVRNLQSAAVIALAQETREAGVLVAFADEIHDPFYVQKSSSLRVAAFASPGFGPLGYLIEGVPVVRRRSHHHRLLPAAFDFRPGRVPVLTCALGSSELLHALSEETLDGLVIAGFGGGHVPPDWIEPVTHLARRVPVVLASRVPEGPVLRRTHAFAGSEIDLLERGLMPAGFLGPLKARLLLSLGIGAGRTRSELAACFAALQPDGM